MKAREMLELFGERAAEGNPAFAEVLADKREYDFNELLPFGKKKVTLAEMLDELTKPDSLGFEPCMNFVGGRLQKYISELAALPEPPKK
jgi:hypothetical protein